MLNRLLPRNLFGQRPAYAAGQALYAAAAAHARTPAFYREGGAPDTIEGRFELYLLHVALLVDRLRGEGPRASETNQVLFDAFLKGLDDALREMGVGDLSVGKKMRRLGEAFYGRAKGLSAALQPGAEPADLPALLSRTLFGDLADADARAAVMAGWVRHAAAELSSQPTSALLDGAAVFPAFPPPRASA